MALVEVELNDYAPDLPDTSQGFLATDGVSSAVHAAIPFVNGWGMLPDFVTIGASALDAACQGAAVLLLTDGSFRVIAGTENKLYEFNGTVLSNRSRVGGYTTSQNRWSFAVYGSFVYATNKIDAVQKSTVGIFANSATIPKCNFVDRVLDFLVVAATNEATFGDQSDRWWCSALGNPDDFTPSIATQSATNRLTDVGGPITASKGLGDDWVIYKQQALYKGSYIGPPDIWSFTLVSNVIGTWGQGCVVKVGYSHFFLGFDDFYVFDGTSTPRPIPNRLKTWLYAGLDKDNAHKICGFYDRYEAIVYWLYPSLLGNGALDSIVAFNLKTQQWGHVALYAEDGSVFSFETLVEYVSGGMTYDEFYPPTGATTWAAVPAISYDSPFFIGNQLVFAAFNASHVLGTLTSVDTLKMLGLRTTFYGDDQMYSTLLRVILRMVVPQSAISSVAATGTHNYRYESGGDTMSETSTFTSSDLKRFDYGESARWHSSQVSFDSADMAGVRLTAMAMDLVKDGEE